MTTHSMNPDARNLQQQYDRLVDDLAYRYNGTFTRDEVQRVITEARTTLTETSKVATFLPILVSRYARELLEAKAVAEGKIAKAKPELLFVCVHNAGRSQMAAAYTTALSGGQVEVRSAGSQPADQVNPAAVEAMLEDGIDMSTELPKLLTTEAVQASDVVITMGCGDACPIFPGKRYEDWALDDPARQGVGGVRPIRDEIKRRVLQLLTSLDVQPSMTVQ